MVLEGVFIEVRRNLRCANVFLTFLQEFTDCGKSLSITLKRDQLVVKNCDMVFQILLEKFEINTHSLSTLAVQGKNASFRVSLGAPTDIVDILVNGNTNFFRDTVKLNIDQGELCNIVCRTCQAPLIKCAQSFNRVLELPSGSVEVSDWFCHNGPSFDAVLAPQIFDIFYGFNHIVLNKENIHNYTLKDIHIYCKRCLQYLGQLIFSGKAMKIWSDCVYLLKDAKCMNIFESEDVDKVLYRMISNVLIESNLDTNLLLIQFSKILAEAIFPNRKSRFIMINVIEKDLEVFRHDTITEGSSTVKLVQNKCFKLLFKLEEDEEQALLKFWQNDINVHNLKISHKLFSNMIKLFTQNAYFIPDIYRGNNGFLLTYVFYPS